MQLSRHTVLSLLSCLIAVPSTWAQKAASLEKVKKNLVAVEAKYLPAKPVDFKIIVSNLSFAYATEKRDGESVQVYLATCEYSVESKARSVPRPEVRFSKLAVAKGGRLFAIWDDRAFEKGVQVPAVSLANKSISLRMVADPDLPVNGFFADQIEFWVDGKLVHYEVITTSHSEREWQSVDGRTMKAKLVGIKNDRAVLDKGDDKKVEVPFNKLSEDSILRAKHWVPLYWR